MTGYGKHEGAIGSEACTFEVRSVNGRYLELSVRMPKEWAEFEHKIREVVKSRVSRGSISIFVRRQDRTSSETVVVDHNLAKQYVAALADLQSTYGLEAGLTLRDLAMFPQIFQGEQETEENPNVERELTASIVQVIDALDEMRVREGNEMARDMEERLVAIGDMVAEVEKLSAERVPAERARLLERVHQLVDEDKVDPQRLQLEIVLLSEKLDVSEETVRLRSHMKHVREDMAVGGVIGRKLNFQLQEMNREVNTIGSKVNDAEVGRLVVSMKEELERIREQVQNIE